jgi:ribosomal protein L1
MGATIVGGEELFDDITNGTLEFDALLATKEIFPKVIKLARILGPKGLMPSPAKGTRHPSLSPRNGFRFSRKSHEEIIC